MRTDDPWYDAVASGCDEHDTPPPAAAVGAPAGVPGGGPPAGHERRGRGADAAVYLAVQRSEAFQRVRRRHRRFVLPATAAFLVWYLAYLGTATAAPELMARPLAGVLNVAMATGLAQFAGAFLLTWAYVRHARLRRDGLALELRWATQELTRKQAGPTAGRTAGESPR